MTISKELLLRILAMDPYNRGYKSGVWENSQIGASRRSGFSPTFAPNQQPLDLAGRTPPQVTETEVTLDANHPLAGQNLNFAIEIVGVDAG